MKKIDLTSKRIASSSVKKSVEAEPEITNMMMDARYLRQSSSLIQDSLQKGFDVLQLANGDIVTTGTKTIVYQYTWDEDRAKLVRIKPEGAKKSKRADADDEDDEMEEAEEA